MNESSSLLIKWILDNVEKLKLTAYEHDWSQFESINLFDCRLKMNLENDWYEGRGTSEMEELAFVKAFCEAVDRSVFVRSKIQGSTNGIAVHSEENLAIEFARCELTERDKFFCHYLTKSPFFSPSVTLEQAGFLDSQLSFLKKNGLTYKLAEMRKSQDVSCFIFMVHGLQAINPLGLMFGMGCRQNPIEAAQSAVYEGLRHVAANLTAGDIPSITTTQFLNLEKWNPESHLHLANDLDYTKEVIKWMFDLQSATENIAETGLLRSLEYINLSLPLELKDAPLFAIHSLPSQNKQNLYFGPTTREHINFDRISKFMGKETQWNQINQTPHPLG